MSITLEKAKAVLKNYADNNYNASKSLQQSGYTEQTSKKASKRILNAVIKKVATEQLKEVVQSNNPLATLLGVVRMTESEVIEEYSKIVKQDKDLATKLKAMLPVLNQLGLKWDSEQPKTTVPILNITVEKIAQQSDVKDVAQSSLHDTVKETEV